MNQIDTNKIINILSRRQQLDKYIGERLILLFQEYEKAHEQTISQASMPGQGQAYEEMKQIKYHPEKSDLSDLLERLYRKEAEYETEIIEGIQSIYSLKDTINRVFTCLYAIPADCYTVLSKIYVKNEKWDTVSAELRISKTTLDNLRIEGLEKIQQLYKSKLTDREIKKKTADIILSGRIRRKQKKIKIMMDVIEGQMSLNEFMDATNKKKNN